MSAEYVGDERQGMGRRVWEIEQRQLIAELLTHYCVLVDRNDTRHLAEQVFSAHGSFELGARHAVVGTENLQRMFAKTLATFTATSHHVSNIVVRFTGPDTADSTAYVYAWHRLASNGRRVDFWGRYTDKLVLTPKGWRIHSRRLTSAGNDGWDNAPFEQVERLANPAETPSPVITKR